MIRLGLCCAFVENTAIRFRTTTARHASTMAPGERERFLREIALHNLDALDASIDWCARHGIGAFRVSSGLLPLYTHPDLGWKLDASLADRLVASGHRARRAAIRLSFHPDQFVVLSSINESSVKLAVNELEYQSECASHLGAEQLTVHGGGAAGGKGAALARFRRSLDLLSERARSLLVLENDDRVYTVSDLLPLCRAEGLALVYDVHHDRCNPGGLSIREATDEAAKTWGKREPWLHLSSPAHGWRSADPRSHADYIAPSDVPREWLGRRATVDVEAKQKELAVLRLRRWLQARERVVHP